tara:strand:- start:4865 stop:4999 length:135 start_codon:yes stop_codon:yes gene_type:complete
MGFQEITLITGNKFINPTALVIVRGLIKAQSTMAVGRHPSTRTG